jgi:AmmeMemoRadiSam system protein A
MQIAAQKRGADAANLISRTNSNDVIGQRGGYVVGYGAVAVYQKNAQKTSSGKIEFAPLDRRNQIELIKMARNAIEQYLEKQTIPEFQATNDFQLEQRGVFVTITKNGQLRGCIGHHESNVPLYKLVPHLAVAAAFGDPRFPPLHAEELDKIKIKISVYLTNVYQIASLDEFEMGVHGIILQKDGRAATFLPEVPLEAGWKTIDEEMVSLCQKAGLPNNAWKNGAEFWVYRTQVFDETVLIQ